MFSVRVSKFLTALFLLHVFYMFTDQENIVHKSMDVCEAPTLVVVSFSSNCEGFEGPTVKIGHHPSRERRARSGAAQSGLRTR